MAAVATQSYPMSPPRSPSRLPSPPPPTEDFTGPQSPSVTAPEDAASVSTAQSAETAARRVRPGTKAADMAEGPPLVQLADIESAFQLTEHLKSLHWHYTHPTSETIAPLSKEQAQLLSSPPEGIDKALWLYELCRFLVQKINSIITSLFDDEPACSSTTCPEMRASEWQYLCAVHDPPKPCCAIDYCCHTLDWAANVLTSPKHFPSRLALTPGTDSTHSAGFSSIPSNTSQTPSPSTNAPQHQVRQLTNIFRRVYRIFAHAWFQHREMFWRVEHQTGLYIFFKTVCDVYNLIPADNYTIPPEAEGEEAAPAAPVSHEVAGAREEPEASQVSAAPAPSILRRPAEQAHIVDASAASNTVVAAGAARRHRRDLSKTSLGPVETVVEEAEEEDEDEGETRSTSTMSRPTTLKVTETTIHVPQAGDEGGTESHIAAAEESRPSSFPDFDDEEEDDERQQHEQFSAEAGSRIQGAASEHTGSEDVTRVLPDRSRTANFEGEEEVTSAEEQAQAPAADPDAAAKSVQD